MTLRGKIQNGVVVLENSHLLADGTEVTVTPCLEVNGAQPPSGKPSIWQKMIELGKKAEAEPCDLPEDLALNHDHYLHGLPKRQ